MTDNPQQEKPLPVKQGKTGPPRRPPSTEATETGPAPDFDARQARIRETRRKGPELGGGRESGALEEAEPVPPTECDDENDE